MNLVTLNLQYPSPSNAQIYSFDHSKSKFQGSNLEIQLNREQLVPPRTSYSISLALAMTVSGGGIYRAALSPGARQPWNARNLGIPRLLKLTS